MPPALLAKIHGATTHFPITLVLGAWVLDTVAFVFPARSWTRPVLAAGMWSLSAAAVAVVPAIISGVLMTRGSVWGHGLLRLHHLFVWPSFALTIGFAIWRVQVGALLPRRVHAVYLLCGFTAAGLISAAAYWGGELLLAG